MKYQRTKLINGSPLIVLGIPSYAVTISAYIKAGFRSDPIKNPGLSHFVEHMNFSGTKKYPTHRDLAFAIERYGGWHYAYTWVDYQSHFVHLPYKYFREGVDVLSETLYKSLLLREEMEKEKGRVKEEINRNMSDPEKAIIPHVWFPLFFQSTILGRSYSGSLGNIKNISREDIVKFYNSYIRNGETCFIVAGGISLLKAKEIIDNYLKRNNVDSPKVALQLPIKISSNLRVLSKKTDSNYVALMVGIPTTSLYIRDRHMLEILRNILARDFGARLPDRLRNQGGLIYTCYASQENFIDTGYFYFKTSTHKNNVEKVVRIIIEEFQRLAQGDISDEEVDTAKENLSGSLYSNMQTGFDYIHWYGVQELLNPDEVIHLKEQIQIYNQISKKEILDTARSYFSTGKILIAAYGNYEQKKLEKILTRI